jgi:two-component system, NtrC family, sensor kinase
MAPSRRSLRLELVATLAVVIMMAAVSLSLATELLGRRRHEQLQLDRLGDHAEGLGVIVGPTIVGAAPGAAHTSQVEQVLRPSLGTLGITTISIHRVGQDTAEVLFELGLPDDVPPPVGRVSAEARTRRTMADGRFVIDEPLRTFAGKKSTTSQLVLRLVAGPSPWTRASDWSDIAILTGGIGAVLLLLGFVLVDVQVLRPLRAVQRGVQRVAAGDLETRVPSDGPREFRDLADAFNAMTGSLRDKVEQIEAQRERIARNEQLATVGRIAAGTAHEVGNPLAAILGYVELLLDTRNEPPLPESQRVLLQRAQTQLLRIQTTIRQLLDFSRPTQKIAERVDLQHAAERLLTLLRHDPRCADVGMSVEVDESVVAIADPALLDQIVQNLVVNAARAARGGARSAKVVVRAHRESDQAILEVEDSGPGVPEDARERLFEPFFTTAKAGEGTGLGLAVSLGLAESMDGGLRLHAARGGTLGGASFRLVLPLAGDTSTAR